MNWLNKYENGGQSHMDGLTDKGFNYNGAWGGQFQEGGTLPGSPGFMYSRISDTPSEGPYAKKTMPSAYYGDVIKDDRGQWAHPGEITEIDSNDITMQGVPYPVLGISDRGDVKLMQPGMDYKFKGKKVTEFPVAELGINNLDAQPLQRLEELTNFTNISSGKKNWLSKYE